jgi:signal transduction histidine kinase
MSATLLAAPVEPLLRVRNLSKQAGKLTELDDVSFDLAPGEILGLVGRRGMGKTSLVHALAGMAPVQRGTIWYDGRPIHFAGPHQARRASIEVAHEQPALHGQLDVLGNLFLGHEQGWRERWRWDALTQRAEIARALLAKLDLPPALLHEPVSQLNDEQRQAIAILRSVNARPRLFILDEALEALSFERQERCLDLLRELAVGGCAVLLVSEDLKAIFAVTDRILVLYEGRILADRRTQKSTQREIVELIVGSTRSEQVTPVIWALESYRSAQQQSDQLHHAQDLLQRNLDAQGTLNRQLVERMRRQVSALDQLNIALRATQSRLMTEREDERKHLARELHDGIIQDLLSFNYQLDELESAEPDVTRRAELEALRHNIRQAVVSLRQLCSDLRPPTIDSHGLRAAIRSYANEWAEANEIAVELDLDENIGRLTEAMELSVFRVVQEGLTNVRRHARASRVQVTIKRTETERLLVRLQDNGRGLARPIDLASLSASRNFGLVGISERAALLGGTMRITSQPDTGTTLEIEIPTPSPSA